MKIEHTVCVKYPNEERGVRPACNCNRQAKLAEVEQAP